MSHLEILNAEAGLLQPREQIFCMTIDNNGGGHLYFTPDALNTPEDVCAGGTTIIGASAGRAPFLMNWMFRQGASMAVMGTVPEDTDDLQSKEAMDYGTFFHGLIPAFVQNGNAYDPMHLPQAVSTFFLRKNLTKYNADAWTLKAKRHLIAFAQFVEDEGVKFLAVELPVILRDVDGITFRMGTRIDLVLETTACGMWIVDNKTGEKQYTDSREYEYQLALNRLAFHANFPEYRDVPLKHANWSPKPWKSNTKKLYWFDERKQTPLPVLHSLVTKFWYEHGDTFLKGHSLTFSEDVIRPGAKNFEYLTHYDEIKNFLTQEEN